MLYGISQLYCNILFCFPDTTPPSGFRTTGPPKRTNERVATFGWRTSEDSNYECYLDNQVDPTNCGDGTSGEFRTNSLGDGPHNFSVMATDDLGNTAPIVNSKWTVGTFHKANSTCDEKCSKSKTFWRSSQNYFVLALFCTLHS